MTLPPARLPPPPSRAQVFRTDSLDEVRAVVSRSDGEHSRVVHGRGSLGYERHVLQGRRVAVGWGRLALAQTLRGSLASPTLHFPDDGAGEYAFGRRRLRVAPGSAILVAPGWEFTRRSGAGSLSALSVDRVALADEIDARAPEHAIALQSEAVPLAAASDVLSATIDLLALPNPVRSAGMSEHLEARIVSAVADLVLRQVAFSRTASAAAARVASLEGWIDAHLEEPITLGRLCRVSGLGARSLQLAFVSGRGMSPMRFVTERRLSESRRRLMRAEPHQDVTYIAMSVGFTHLGRFSALYRHAYGESPSETMRSGRRGVELARTEAVRAERPCLVTPAFRNSDS